METKKEYKTLVVKNKIKKLLPRGMRLSKDFPQALNNLITQIILKTAERAKANERKTLMSKDL